MELAHRSSELTSARGAKGGRESLFSVSPECTGRLKSRDCAPPLSLWERGTFNLPPERAGSVPRKAMAACRKKANRKGRHYLDGMAFKR